MLATLLLLLCLTEHVFAKDHPDVDCIVVHLHSIHCSWNMQGTPVNYTFYSWFRNENRHECSTYLSENNTVTGCILPYKKQQRFSIFKTELKHDINTILKEHNLKSKVKLNPPTNLTVQKQSDSYLSYYWNQTSTNCVESEVRYRVNCGQWQISTVSIGREFFDLHSLCSNSQYELQVRSKIGNDCGESLFWSDWSEPVVWGSNSETACTD